MKTTNNDVDFLFDLFKNGLIYNPLVDIRKSVDIYESSLNKRQLNQIELLIINKFIDNNMSIVQPTVKYAKQANFIPTQTITYLIEERSIPIKLLHKIMVQYDIHVDVLLLFLIDFIEEKPAPIKYIGELVSLLQSLSKD